MLMVIFGAGASYDSSWRHPVEADKRFARDIYGQSVMRPLMYRPPLANELFSGRFDDFAMPRTACTAILNQLRIASEEAASYTPGSGDTTPPSIEQALETISQEAGGNPTVAGQLLDLRWYLNDVVGQTTNEWLKGLAGTTNYNWLLDDVRRWQERHDRQVQLVTFNYDNLLDDACRRVLGMTLQRIPDYVSDEGYRIFKVHGSINRTHGVQASNGLRGVDPSLFTNGKVPFLLADIYAEGRPHTVNNGLTFVPAIAVPTRSKSAFECPREHLEMLRAAIPEVTDLLIIGWRGMDRHFLRLWAGATERGSKMKRALIVTHSQSSANEVKDRLVADARINGTVIETSAAGGFTASLRSGEIAQFLRDGQHSS